MCIFLNRNANQVKWKQIECWCYYGCLPACIVYTPVLMFLFPHLIFVIKKEFKVISGN